MDIHSDTMFLEEVMRAARRYFNNRDADKLIFGEGTTEKFSQAMPEIQEECQQIRSPWDRRSVMFKKLDKYYWAALDPLTKAHRLLEDRYPKEALKILEQTAVPEDGLIISHYYTVYTNVLNVLEMFDKAMQTGEKACSFDAANTNAKLALADAIYLSGRQDDASKIYMSLLSKNENIRHPVELLGFEGNKLRSPILAIIFLESRDDLPEQLWTWAEDEYYFSPHFRCLHAYWLLEKKHEVFAAFAKLMALFKEMPWIKEAAINLMELYKFIDPHGERGIMTEARCEIDKIIRENNWVMGKKVRKISCKIE